MIKIYLSTSTDPWFNLATEEWLFQEMTQFEHVLFLWRNQETVVIGRSQNPWLECHLDNMKKDDITLARRQSGGGAVFHDLGNTNFTFLSKKSLYDKSHNLAIILKALQAVGVEAQDSGRNDIVVDTPDGVRKISGNAFKEKKDRAFHHGTLLVNADMNRLQNYLNPNKKKLEAKGVTSVRSRVTNVVDINPGITHELICDAIISEFNAAHQVSIEPEELLVSALNQKPGLNDYYKKMGDWDWLYGQTLPFTHHFSDRFSWGVVDLQLVVKNAVIQQVKIYTDSLEIDLFETVENCLCAMPYKAAALTDCFESLLQQCPKSSSLLLDLQALIQKEL